MKREVAKLLVVDDNDVECKTDSKLEKMTIGNLNFIPKDLDKFDMIIYQGKRGTKILKSKYSITGIVK